MDQVSEWQSGFGYHETGEGQKRLSEALKVSERNIVALALREVPRNTIAALYGVSRECVSQRLRRYGVSRGRGRPRDSQRAIPGR